jgi:hypothetical protein
MGVNVSTIDDTEVGFTLHLELQNRRAQDQGGRWLVARSQSGALHFRGAFLIQKS